VAFLSAWIC
jgi:hypothetical protein